MLRPAQIDRSNRQLISPSNVALFYNLLFIYLLLSGADDNDRDMRGTNGLMDQKYPLPGGRFVLVPHTTWTDFKATKKAN